MSPQMSLILFTTLLLCIACQYAAHCSAINVTGAETKANISEDHEVAETKVETVLEYDEESDEEEAEEESSLLGYITDDSIRVQPVIKPETPAKKGEKKTANKKNGDKKNSDKKKNKGKKKGNKKKPSICDTTHKDFCIHGECKFIESLQEVTCRCHQDYFGERCSEQSMKTQKEDLVDVSTIALAVAVVLLSAISIIAIIIIVVHTRRKYSTYECEAEEKKKLGQENGSEEIDV